MNNRILGFYAVSIVLVLVASYFQNRFYPAVPKDAQANVTKLAEPVTELASVGGEGQAATAPANQQENAGSEAAQEVACLLYTSPSPRDKRQSRMPSSA